MDWFGVFLAPISDLDLKLIKLLAGKSPLKSSASNGLKVGGETLWFLEESLSGGLVAKILFEEIDALCVKLPAVHPSLSNAFVAQTENSICESALERVGVSSSRIIRLRQPLGAFVRSL